MGVTRQLTIATLPNSFERFGDGLNSFSRCPAALKT
jgi:hypothetical protein